MKEKKPFKCDNCSKCFFIKNKLEFTHLIYSWRTNTIQLWYLCLDFLILSGLPNKSYVSLQVEIVTITSLANRTWKRIFPIMSVTNFCSHSKQFWISSQLLDLICQIMFQFKMYPHVERICSTSTSFTIFEFQSQNN